RRRRIGGAEVEGEAEVFAVAVGGFDLDAPLQRGSRHGGLVGGASDLVLRHGRGSEGEGEGGEQHPTGEVGRAHGYPPDEIPTEPRSRRMTGVYARISRAPALRPSASSRAARRCRR